jgi:hypothetical protein
MRNRGNLISFPGQHRTYVEKIARRTIWFRERGTLLLADGIAINTPPRCVAYGIQTNLLSRISLRLVVLLSPSYRFETRHAQTTYL